jgi:hypothetical protein
MGKLGKLKIIKYKIRTTLWLMPSNYYCVHNFSDVF